MRRLPWHVSLRADRRALLTSLGISLGVAFSVVGFTIASALEGEAIADEGRFAQPDVLVGRGATAFSAAGLPEGATLRVLLVEASDEEGRTVVLAGLEGPRAPLVERGDARAGAESGVEGDTIELTAPARASLLVATPVIEPFVSVPWVIVDAAELRELAGLPADAITYAHYPALAEEEIARLRAEGHTVDRVPGVEPFYSSSAVEIARTLLLLVAFCSLLVALFTHEFLRTEIRERRRELGLWRSVGMRVRDVATLLVARGAFIVVVGAAMGFLWAIMALAAASRVVGARVLETLPSALTCAALFAAYLAAGIAGALLPALAESRKPVREWLEALV